MKIILSRHAKRRMQLYKIDEDDVLSTVTAEFEKSGPPSVRTEVVNHQLKNKYGYPLKVVFEEIRDKITVITAYPLRKERRS